MSSIQQLKRVLLCGITLYDLCSSDNLHLVKVLLRSFCSSGSRLAFSNLSSFAAAAQPGEFVVLKGSEASEAYPKECKQWKKLLPSLAVQSSMATFAGTLLVCPSGSIIVNERIPDGASIS